MSTLFASIKDVKDLKVKTINIGNTRSSLPITDDSGVYLITFYATSYMGELTHQCTLTKDVSPLSGEFADRSTNYIAYQITLNETSISVVFDEQGLDLDDIKIVKIDI